MNVTSRTRLLTALFVTTASGCVPDDRRPDRRAEAYLRIAAAEDARPSGGQALELLTSSITADDPFLRALAVRALGRLEDPSLVGRITPTLNDRDPGVRTAAAHALAQSVHRTTGERALEFLVARAEVEADARVLRELARSLGRLNLEDDDVSAAVSTLLRLSGAPDVSTNTLVGVALALEARSRSPRSAALGAAAVARLHELAAYSPPDADRDTEAARVRALAITALGQIRQLPASTVTNAFDDADPGVRLAAIRFGGRLPPDDRQRLHRRALSDEAPTVRIAAVQALSSGPQTAPVCADLITATTDGVDGVRISALDALGEPCPDRDQQARILAETASRLPPAGDVGWQAPAHAFLALARIAPASADTLLSRFAEHPNSFVRAYAATGAGILGTEPRLRALAGDEHPNVRSAALQPLFAARGHAIDEVLIDQLTSDDPQLLLIASNLLAASTQGPAVASSAMAAFERISEAGRETLRDPRRALLERVAEFGDSSLAGRLRPFMSDYDPEVAADVAEILTSWTGERQEPRPERLPRAPLPTASQLENLARTTVVLRMLRGGEIVVRPLPDLALTNAFRFVRLAGTGYFDGLTFHRWVPNFVLQGGSPGANEYWGDGPYSRDEVGLLSHFRGTVGLSTRGRDTGDAQIFVNLIDNVRLDHDYTIYGEVVSGMNILDSLVEGDVIERAEVRIAP